MSFHDLIIAPLSDFAFMRRALLACLATSLTSAPLGVLLLLRRMSLVGDSMSHALLPGAALGFILGGASFSSLSIGGLLAGVVVALLSGWVSESTRLREDGSFAAFYLLSLAFGVLLISVNGTQVDLAHILFGSILNIDDSTTRMILVLCFAILLIFFFFGRVLVIEGFEREYLKFMGVSPRWVRSLFMILVVLCLVGGFQSLGTLLAVGLMMIPAATGRLLSAHLPMMMIWSVVCALTASVAGLLISFHAGWPSGPTIVILCGLWYCLALLFAPGQGLVQHLLKQRHYEK